MLLINNSLYNFPLGGFSLVVVRYKCLLFGVAPIASPSILTKMSYLHG